jgi:hypothetical protein
MTTSGVPVTMDTLAAAYIKLVLSVGLHDADYVDAYYGPPHLRVEVDAEKPSLESIKESAAAALRQAGTLAPARDDEMARLRHRYIIRQLESLASRVDILLGKKLLFDEEARALYDAEPPVYPEEHFKKILKELEGFLPGKGAIPPRYDAYKSGFIISKDKLDSVFQAAVRESRERTKRHINLPDDESFVIEYVTGKSWSGYNWYKGNSHSLIQINTDLPIYIDRAVDLASHEGYPGHHVYNALLERHLVRERSWPEFTVYALFSPQSLIAEGTANFGIDMAYPGPERVGFEREILFPAAGLDGSRAEEYYRIHELVMRLNYAGNEAARGYLDGKLTREQAAEWLVNYALISPERALQRTRFFDQYRSYVINYNLGQDLVKHYIESRGGTADKPGKRWEEFGKLLSSPRLPSGLKEH